MRFNMASRPRWFIGGSRDGGNCDICTLTFMAAVRRRTARRERLGAPVTDVHRPRRRKGIKMGQIDHSAYPMPHAVTERLLDWHEQAKYADRQWRESVLLLLAWKAFDRPVRTVERDSSGAARSVPN